MSLSVVRALNGGEAVALAVRQCNVDVISAYPITPQTIIVERLSEYVANGETHAEYVNVESEHSALSVCMGAAAGGARTFTATSSQGLALMWELLYVTSGLRLPVVMAVVNRALSAPINIHCDHSDSMGARDSGWIQLYVENSQEAYDTIVQAYRVAEHSDIQLPVMVNLDGFHLSHTLERVNMMPDSTVSDFVGFRKHVKVKVEYLNHEVPAILDGHTPISLGIIALSDYYYEFKKMLIDAMERAKYVIKEVHDEYRRISGRGFGDGLVDLYRVDDADAALVVMGSASGTVKHVVRDLRGKGMKVGLIKLRSFRPFPYEELIKALSHVKAVGVMDRATSPGAYGAPLFNEMRNVFYDLDIKPTFINYVYGIGGRELEPTTVKQIFDDLLEAVKGVKPSTYVKYVGVRQ
ncbi:MAG: pyruvate ferredoxin oxidoreductase [Sulfolobales archaeon]|nr:pyruvate ferredoxin oxidoreductase [Sulfolobales archaeon]MDW7969467.1 pyruvate ferredoxin oxidoreductase [Sulfolobales archaeon]